MERRGELACSWAPSRKRGCLKEVQIQALADQQVRQSSLQAHQGFLPSSRRNSGHLLSGVELSYGESGRRLNGLSSQPLLNLGLFGVLAFASSFSLPLCLHPPSLAHLLIAICEPGSVLCTGAQRWVRQPDLLPEEDLESCCTPHNFPHLLADEPGDRPFPHRGMVEMPPGLTWPF